MGDLDALEFAQMFAGERHIEGSRERLAKRENPHPRDIQHDEVRGTVLPGLAQLGELRARVAPDGAVDHQPVDPAIQVRLPPLGEIALPEENQRQVALEMSEDDVAQRIAQRAPEEKCDLLRADRLAAGAAHLTMRRDPGAHSRLSL